MANESKMKAALAELREFALVNPNPEVDKFLEAAEEHFCPSRSAAEPAVNSDPLTTNSSSDVQTPPQTPPDCLPFEACVASTGGDEIALLAVLEEQIRIRLGYILTHGVEVIEINPNKIEDAKANAKAEEEQEAAEKFKKKKKKKKRKEDEPSSPPAPPPPNVLKFVTRALQILQTPFSGVEDRPDEKPFPFLIRLMVTSQPPSKLNKSRPYRNLVQKMMEELEFDFEWDDYLDEEEEEDGDKDEPEREKKKIININNSSNNSNNAASKSMASTSPRPGLRRSASGSGLGAGVGVGKSKPNPLLTNKKKYKLSAFSSRKKTQIYHASCPSSLTPPLPPQPPSSSTVAAATKKRRLKTSAKNKDESPTKIVEETPVKKKWKGKQWKDR
ncbi:hypothetical protein TrVE_jg7237 [Triparma verrucosa]|uniref:Uncharacterized protein n=1 Tax=Triparma verrucosa TaxID=1606542 RepID=A0A9W7C6A3_9STRA|nr:hypothetical protein TrVE_jg7237 [Triparma verrucosa]